MKSMGIRPTPTVSQAFPNKTAGVITFTPAVLKYHQYNG
ncbi:hypothetical protein yaldo0001_28030 [Yersinia aldovae ATCC 35236]|nr:hypothetical protein yaldo0001_28030 [Yersinia aldovae ATCC 35236]